MTRLFKEFKATVDGVEQNFKVYKPVLADQKEAQKARNIAFYDAVKSKSILRSQLNSILRERGLWDDEKEAHFEALRREILEGERKLEGGGFMLDEAKILALQIKKLRNEMTNMLVERSILDNETCEGQADNMAFNSLVSTCTFLVYDSVETRYFKSLEDYLERSYEDVANKAASELSGLLHGNFGNEAMKGLCENKFLLEYGFVDEKLRLINEEGHLVDDSGRLLNESGNYVNESGELVDMNGNKLDKDGNYIVEHKPFFDKNGNPVVSKKKQSNDVTADSGVVPPVEETLVSA